jgi:transposase
MSHDLRAMLDAIGYLTRYGIEWRALPVDFPPWTAVYAFFERWSNRKLPIGWPMGYAGVSVSLVAARSCPPPRSSTPRPYAAPIPRPQPVPAMTRGKTKGWKRNVATDCLGLVLMVTVTGASVQDRDGAHRLLALLRERLSTISLVWADGGYAGRLVTWATIVLCLTVTIVKRTDKQAGFVVLPRRWVVERTFGWLTRHRRLVRDYERRPEHHEAMVRWATIAIMIRRLDRGLTGTTPQPRWGQLRQTHQTV